ncbi:hypothetical protein [Micromonospora tarensis]|uniref:Uncharacterized protein n=1 Tax=Micromonospora tarensis TaxID=2806100 RepID=A0ABS1YCL6_9ACTN|nr:hypothetical protein [Micromonospora tarensis]MBM0275117.1 hypothetical protein [Micromonospora tarensis]
MHVCGSCAAGNHFCAGSGCECFCDAPDAYWSDDTHVCDICESCEDDLADEGRPVVTVELPGISR